MIAQIIISRPIKTAFWCGVQDNFTGLIPSLTDPYFRYKPFGNHGDVNYSNHIITDR